SAGVEVRVDAFDPAGRRSFNPIDLRSSSTRPMVYTRRSGEGRGSLTAEELRSALDAGFDLVDVEVGAISHGSLTPHLDRILLSLHDYRSVPPLDQTIREMTASGARFLKVAVTPASFEEDRVILECVARRAGAGNLTLFGMGRHGLYSRTLAPFLGSQFSFVAIDEDRAAAPGQLPIDRAAALWDRLPSAVPEYLFAVVGNPAIHSQSPRIHNARFREAGFHAAYGIIEADSLVEVLEAMERRLPCAPSGLSVTAPFKKDLLHEGMRRGWTTSERANRVGSANTLVSRGESFVVDNTDVLGFARALEKCPRGLRVAIIGAGGTGRAAAFAAFDRGLDITIFNRTTARAEELARIVRGSARSVEEPGEGSFDVVIDTVPADALGTLALRLLSENGYLIRVAYDGSNTVEESARFRGIEIFGALDLLDAQAEEQSKYFIQVAGGE
ncbi:MAG: type I 3-dehydroquinate dehydratase, partial [Acidobacteria bacterium]|nr:type I 3-dehydroquinate dehydratase [Acidobacteriota bacterium]